MLRVAAVDLGASSVRVATVDLDKTSLEPEIVHRFAHAPVLWPDGSLRWHWDGILSGVRCGLELALDRAPLASIGIDAWGVDYGLLDVDGALLSPPYSYRDERTAGWRDVAQRIGEARLYKTTGIQLLPINTIFQLAAHDRGELASAQRLLMMPDLVVHALTGEKRGERTSAGTSALVDAATGDWSKSLLEDIGVDPSIMPGISPATERAGTWRGVDVTLVGGHDTASAVAALPSPRRNAVFISSGTWMLVGVERDAPDVSDAAMAANFSNEPGVFGNVRFLRNVMGLWLLDQCIAAWGNPALLSDAAAMPAGGPTFDARDPRFVSSRDVEADVRSAAGLPASANRITVARCILDSLAYSAAEVVRDIARIVGETVPEIIVVGGGSRNGLLNRLIEEAAGIPVRIGPAEATLVGNALVQGIALGRWADLAEARRAVG